MLMGGAVKGVIVDHALLQYGIGQPENYQSNPTLSLLRKLQFSNIHTTISYRLANRTGLRGFLDFSVLLEAVSRLVLGLFSQSVFLVTMEREVETWFSCLSFTLGYNSVLSTHSLLEHTDVTVLLDNEVMHDICRHSLYPLQHAHASLLPEHHPMPNPTPRAKRHAQLLTRTRHKLFGAMSPKNNARIGVLPLLNSVSMGEILGSGHDKKMLGKDQA